MDNEPCSAAREQTATRLSEKSFESIHDAYRPRLLRYLARLVGVGDAEDLTQITLMRVSAALPGFRGEANLSTWIYRIATNAALDKLRRTEPGAPDRSEWPRPNTGDDVDFDADLPPGTEQAPPAEAAAIRAEMSRCVRDFVDRLPEHYRTVLVLSELEGLKNSEIAAVLDISLDMVKIRLHRARQRLRKDLTSGCSLYHDERSELACDRVAAAVTNPARTTQRARRRGRLRDERAAYPFRRHVRLKE